jgi:hypothetical protein
MNTYGFSLSSSSVELSVISLIVIRNGSYILTISFTEYTCEYIFNDDKNIKKSKEF